MQNKEKRKNLETQAFNPEANAKVDLSDKRIFKSGATSTRQPRLSLIPHRGLVNVAERFELGLVEHGSGAYNALSNGTSKCLSDRDWLIERCSHAIEHAYSMIDLLKSDRGMLEIKTDLAIHAGAVGWCGIVLGEAALDEDDD